jgi:hypothetical protein
MLFGLLLLLALTAVLRVTAFDSLKLLRVWLNKLHLSPIANPACSCYHSVGSNEGIWVDLGEKDETAFSFGVVEGGTARVWRVVSCLTEATRKGFQRLKGFCGGGFRVWWWFKVIEGGRVDEGFERWERRLMRDDLQWVFLWGFLERGRVESSEWEMWVGPPFLKGVAWDFFRFERER